MVSLEEIAEHLKVSTDTIHAPEGLGDTSRWIRARKMPAYRVGRFWRFDRSFDKIDALDVADRAGMFESDRRRH